MREKRSLLYRLVAVVIIFSFILVQVGCPGKPQKKPQQSPNQKKDENKVPKELIQLQSSLEQVFEAMRPVKAGSATQKPAGQTATQGTQGDQAKQTQRKQQQGQQQGQSDQGEGQDNGQQMKQQDGQEGGQNQQAGQPGGQQQQPPQQLPGQIDWDKQQQQVEQIHQQWNTFEPKAMKAGARPETIEALETELNTLTVKAIAKDRYGTQLAANRAAQYIPDFLLLFQSPSPPDLSRLRYLNRDIMLKAEVNDWAGAEKDAGEMLAIWNRVRSEVKDKEEDSVGKVDFALTDINQAVKIKDKVLVRIKADIIEKNLLDLKKSMEKQGAGQGSSGQDESK